MIPVVKAQELPRLNLYGDIDFMSSKTDKREITIELVDKEYGFKEKGTIKLQGSSSLQYDKKNYNISFDSEVETSLGSYKKYTLKANWVDELHIRNLLTANVISEINNKYDLFDGTVNYGLTDGFYVEVYNNDEYLGLYSMNIHKDYIFAVDDEEVTVIAVKEDVDQSYFRELENEKWEGFEVEEGEQNEENLERLNRLIDFVDNSSDKDFKEKFGEYFNLDSALNYYCIMHVLELSDNVVNNLYLVSYDGQIWYLAFYDLDISWGGGKYQNKLLDFDNKLNKEVKSSRLWSRFEKVFASEIKERYKELRSDYLSEASLKEKYYEYLDKIPKEALMRENEKWGNKLTYNTNYIDDFLEIRLRTIDSKIDGLKGERNYLLLILILLVILLLIIYKKKV